MTTATLPSQTDILAALSKMDTLAQAELLSRGWEQMLADAADDEHSVLAFVGRAQTVSQSGVSTSDALDHAWGNLRDYRDGQRGWAA